ncbi:MAG: hypothetical protein JWP97_6624 [Labilithrix sp.]|nr:hypothetical protein [Labilithrix sp.]
MSGGSNFDHEARAAFLAFLERFAKGNADPHQWQELVVTHYLDATLERTRQDCVRLRARNGDMHWSTAEHEQIQSWIRTLRTAGG